MALIGGASRKSRSCSREVKRLGRLGAGTCMDFTYVGCILMWRDLEAEDGTQCSRVAASTEVIVRV